MKDDLRVPIRRLTHAVAVAFGGNLAKGLVVIEQLGASGELGSYYLYYAARADILRRLERTVGAANAYTRALSLTANAVERRYLRRRLATLTR
jgi:RNA polymerase sigma-70 factor, ECF subfamily